MNDSVTCHLLNLETNKKINLPHGEVIILGRNEETENQDLYVSKNQIECSADTDNYKVKLKPIGRSICGIDGYAVSKDKTYTVGHGHRIELRLGYHEHEIVFDPPPEENITQVAKKPKLDFPIFNLKNDSDVQSNEKEPYPDVGKWEDIDRKELLIYTAANCKGKAKIAAFDVDGTIIKTKSGARFPKDGDDWQLYIQDIPHHLKKLNDDEFKIVFFTNQSGIGKDSKKIKEFKRKIENIVSKISLPIQVFIATGKSAYRKPVPGMWNVLVDEKNDNICIDKKNSFYVGDAAGREKNWAVKKNKDHSIADRLFAINIGIKFYTPEEHFLKAKPVAYTMPDFDPRNLSVASYPEVKYNKPNVIIMVGGPGSGKSYFCCKVLIGKGYIHISRDKLGSWQKCVNSLEENLEQKQNCVIDNTNPDKESRARFVQVAKKFNIDCYCFLMTTNFKQTKHNNKFRELTDRSHEPVSEIIINSYKNKFQEPEKSEGFKEIVKIPFVPQFNNTEDERLYKMFLLEK
ncbi:uncharacterized protein F21D5.5 [Anoplophora glabripennis]|uniref:uncharacterized protein F21D5.5 n=1 Tax=Anoplophora glabripennis TaxID=217634 RepID=UPI000873C427|nr:uncharacterized protein F21D5.5 [Anoplophora glabripennis]